MNPTKVQEQFIEIEGILKKDTKNYDVKRNFVVFNIAISKFS